MSTERGEKPANQTAERSAFRHPSLQEEESMELLGAKDVAVPHVEADQSGLVLRQRADGRLIALKDGKSIAVKVRQLFPWSEPRRHLSLRDDDDAEIALVEDPSALDETSRAALENALAAAGFVLEITRVLEIDEEVEIRHWTVETKQGRRTFQTHLDDWPRVLPSGGRLIRDVGGDLYHLADPTQMDKRSRELLWAFVD
jgi:hypothetical protein